VRHDAVKTPLQQPYDGPFKVVERHEKHITILRSGKKVVVSIDRLKPAFVLADTAQDHPVRECATRTFESQSTVTMIEILLKRQKRPHRTNPMQHDKRMPPWQPNHLSSRRERDVQCFLLNDLEIRSRHSLGGGYCSDPAEKDVVVAVVKQSRHRRNDFSGVTSFLDLIEVSRSIYFI
jgi:hypothetical protein